MSLDTRRQQLRSPPTPLRQDFTTVSEQTNTGLTTTQQHVLREAQQQRIARPGHGQPYANMANDENYLISPHSTPHSRRFDAACYDRLTASPQQPDCVGVGYDMYGAPINLAVKRSPASFTNNMAGAQDFELFGQESSLSSPTFMNFQESPTTAQGWTSEGDTSSTRRSSRRISNGIMDRVSKFENMGMETVQRPMTPPNQNGASYFPPTPMETPHDRMAKHDPRPQRFSDDYDESMEETIKPNRNRSNRASGIFQEMRQQAEAVMPTPPRSQMVPSGRGYGAGSMPTGDYMNMSNVNAEFMKIENPYNGLPAQPNSLHASPHTPYMGSFNGPAFESRPDLQPPDCDSQLTMTPQYHNASRSPSQTDSPSRRLSPHRRTESIASIASAASIASINIEETKTETGVNPEDIAQFIEGPDPTDGKWLCLYDDCGKRFGRKENIKSHVQTHLNDRQYQCPNCKKCFVRQHDLKRHAKIHTGIKPYPCECGNSFARHDALTRHRQRGMCIGAFDGIVRKVVKRGRPRKNRPDMDSRLDKSSRTRNKNRATGSPSSSSSQSGYSDSSAANSPMNDFDMLDDKPFAEIMEAGMAEVERSSPISTTMPMNPTALSVSTAPMPNLAMSSAEMNEVLAVCSPEHIASPSAMSHYSHVSHVSIANGEVVAVDGLPVVGPSSPAKSVASHYTHQPGTPPELSASSSPPPSSSTRYFDLDPNSSGTDMSIGLGTTMMGRTSIGGTSGADFGNISGLSLNMDDDSLLQAFTNEDGLVQLDREFSMTGKFEDEYDPVNMFTNSDDVFFGDS